MRPRDWLPLVLSLVVAASTVRCGGEIDNTNFEGWIRRIDGGLLHRGGQAHLINTARVPCAGCYRNLPSLTDHEMVLRLLVPDGRSFVIKLRASDFNVDRLTLPIGTVGEPIRQGDVFVLPSPPVGEAAAWIGLEPFQPGGSFQIIDALWPSFPGDAGYATLVVEGARFDDEDVGGAFTVELFMHRDGDIPVGFGGRDQLCAGDVCEPGLLCIAEREGLMCRATCDASTPCALGDDCVQWPGVGGVCRLAPFEGQEGAACFGGSCLDPGVSCIDDGCRRECDFFGFDPVCGGSSTCDGYCRPTPEVGFTHGPCRENRCDLPGLDCVSEDGGPRCRPLCDPAEPGACGAGFVCRERATEAPICQPG